MCKKMSVCQFEKLFPIYFSFLVVPNVLPRYQLCFPYCRRQLIIFPWVLVRVSWKILFELRPSKIMHISPILYKKSSKRFRLLKVILGANLSDFIEHSWAKIKLLTEVRVKTTWKCCFDTCSLNSE